jgi:hypothetical protein
MTVDPGSASIVRDLPVVSMKVILTMRTKQPDSGPNLEYRSRVGRAQFYIPLDTQRARAMLVQYF